MRLLLRSFVCCSLALYTSAHAEFTLVATHPHAQNQPSNGGKEIRALQVYEGKIYAGYGSSSGSHGPIQICGLDPVSETFSCEATSKTDVISNFRVLDGSLYAPSGDPQGLVWGDAYAAKQNNSWVLKNVDAFSDNVNDDYPAHAKDFGLLQGELYFATDYWDHDAGAEGKGRQFGVIFKSSDNGNSWLQELAFPLQGGNTLVPGTSASNYCFVATLNNKLYVQLGTFYCTRKNSYSDVYDGSTWKQGPSLMPTIAGTRKVINYDNKLILIHGSKLGVFDGVSTTIASDAPIRDYTIYNDEIFVLRTSGHVCRTKNLISFKCFDIAPNNAFDQPPLFTDRIAALNGFVYVGTTHSQIYKAPIPDQRIGFLPALLDLIFEED